jgi:OAA-family lectin sugar binding domain
MNPNDEDVNSTYGRRKILTSLGAIGLGAVALTSIDPSSVQAHGEHVTERAEGRVTYQTENSWGPITEWHAAPDLTFVLNDGIVGDLATLSWRDQIGNSGNISFQSDGSSFFGYYQKENEGPIAYRGTRK